LLTGLIQSRSPAQTPPKPRDVALYLNLDNTRQPKFNVKPPGPAGRLIRSGGDPYAFEARRSITIDRPVGDVFALLSDYANYPDFMPNVRDMETLPGLRHRWKMVGPAGVRIPVRDAITELVPDQFVAWESEPESTLPYAGAAMFKPVGSGTFVEARMSYGPPLGSVGNAFAKLLGQDPGRQLEIILDRARDHLESGRFPKPAVAHP